jgi:hypothetical protein
MGGRQLSFPQPATPAPAQPVDEAMARHREQPGGEGPAGVVALADRMDDQQDVLDAVLDLVALQPGPMRHRSEVGRNRSQEIPIGFRIAVLRGWH